MASDNVKLVLVSPHVSIGDVILDVAESGLVVIPAVWELFGTNHATVLEREQAGELQSHADQ